MIAHPEVPRVFVRPRWFHRPAKEVGMYRVLAALLAAASLAIVSVAAQAPSGKAAPAQKWTAPRAADGHPDLSGVWANNSVTPLERPKEWEGKDHLTDAELEQLKHDIASAYDKEGDAIF